MARLIAFYLPQYHPIPENDQWWGQGFTEWTNVTKAKPLFRGHYQPRLPRDLGFYDLRVPEVREQQAALAKDAGIEGFCYYHYWFGGRRILERPLVEVVAAGKPDFPFCLCWANQSWSGIWHGDPKRILMEQTYPGKADEEAHFHALLPAFRDRRYLKVNGRLLFTIFKPMDLPSAKAFIDSWQRLAALHQLPGFYFVAHLSANEISRWNYREAGFDSAVIVNHLRAYHVGPEAIFRRHWKKRPEGAPGATARASAALKSYAWHLRLRVRGKVFRQFQQIERYEDAIEFFLDGVSEREFPCVVPNWDNTARSSRNGYVLDGATPELFKRHVARALEKVKARIASEKIVYIKSWNEWAEGNYMEPDSRFGRQYIDAMREAIRASDGSR